MDSQARLHAISENSIIPIYIKDLNGRYIAANKATQSLFSLGELDIIGKTDAELFEQHHSNFYRNNDLLVQETKRATSFEEDFRSSDGVKTFFSVKAPLLDEDGQVFATSGISIDISERIRYAAELELSNREIQRVNKVKEEFLANISHEIRTPLNAICGISEILMIDELDLKQTNNFLEKLNANAQQLFSLINDVLDFSSIQEEEFDFVIDDFDLQEVVKELGLLTSLKAENKGLSLTFSIEDYTQCYLLGDKTRLMQVLLNLVDNAIKFTHQGEVSVNVRTEEKSNEHVILSFCVMDTGMGISPSLLPKVFNKFYQGSARLDQKSQGTGLGLSISKAIVEKMGGEIYVDSEVGKGTQFSVKVPLSISVKQLGGQKRKSLIDTSDNLESKLPILIVEDNQTNIDVLQQYLLLQNIESKVATNGLDALDILEKTKVGAILMDLQMEGIDGIEVARRIRRHKLPLINKLPIVAVTGHAEASIKKECIDIGMNDFMVKPISLRQLRAILGKYLM